MKEQVYVLGSKKKYYSSIPDNEYMFYAYINMVVNNRQNARLPKRLDEVPTHIGPVKVRRIIGDAQEPYFEVDNNKDYCFIEMIKDQFHLLRSHWNMIQSFEQYPNASRY